MGDAGGGRLRARSGAAGALTGEVRSPRDRGFVLAVLSAAGFLSSFMSSAVNIALPVIGAEYRVSAVTLSWIPLAYILTAGAVLMPSGQLADIRGRMRVYLWGLGIFTVFSFGCALAPNVSWLIGMRLVQGVGAGFIFATATAIVTAAFPVEDRGKALGLLTSGVYLGLTMGPAVGGIITHNLGWRALFWIMGILALIVCAVAFTRFRDPGHKGLSASSFDYVGSLIYGVSLPLALVGFTLIPDVWGIVLIGVGAVGLGLFAWYERRPAYPVLPIRLFRVNRVFAFASLATLINYSATFGMTFLLSLYLGYNRGLSAQTAGLILVAGAFVQAVFSMVAGRLVDRISARAVASAGMVLCIAGLLGLSFLTATTPYWYVITMLCVLGMGFAFYAPAIMHSVMGSVEKRHLTVASATISTMRLAGQNLSIGLAALVLALVVGGQQITPDDYPGVLTSVRITFLLFTALSVIGLGATLVRARDSATAGPAPDPGRR